jgi:signal transduction histidine kinase
MKGKLHRRNKLHIYNNITAATIAAIFIVSIIISFRIYTNTDFSHYSNDARILVSEQKNELEQGIYEKGQYPYLVFDLTGTVLYCTPEFGYQPGEAVNVQELLQYDKSFAGKYPDQVKESFVLQRDNVTWGFAVFLLPESKVYRNTNKALAAYIFLPLLIGFLISMVLLLIRTLYFNHRVIGPLREIAASARAIISGNYNLEVLRTYWKRADDNEVGELSYAFELMRDELKQKQIREEELKKSQQELISCISHDLKTPISTIKAYGSSIRLFQKQTC